MSGDGGGAAQPGEAAAAHAPSSESHGDINLEPALAPSGGGDAGSADEAWVVVNNECALLCTNAQEPQQAVEPMAAGGAPASGGGEGGALTPSGTRAVGPG